MKKSSSPPFKAQGDEIRAARNAAKLTQAELADKIGITASAVSQWERGESHPDPENQAKLKRLFSGEVRLLPTPQPQVGRRIKVINRAERSWEELAEETAPSERQLIVEDAASLGPETFALEIASRANEPQYCPGDVVIIDPAVEPAPGDMVAAKLGDSEVAVFRRYRLRGRDRHGNPSIELAPWNADFETLRIDADRPGEILGTMVEHRRYRQRAKPAWRD